MLEILKNDKNFENIKDIDKDIEKLTNINSSLKSIRDKKIAHSTSTKVSSKITYNDIASYTKTIQEIIRKYYLLFFSIVAASNSRKWSKSLW